MYQEYPLGQPVTLVLAPGETLLFSTSSGVRLTLIANVLSEEQHGAMPISRATPRYRARYQTTNANGFQQNGLPYSGVATWMSSTRRFEATVDTDSIAVESFVPGDARFAGVSVRVRLTGYNDSAATIGVATEGGEFFGYSVPRGAWSRWMVIRAGEAIRLHTAEKLGSAAAVVADLEIELSPERASECCEGVAAAGDGSPGEPPVAGGAVPVGDFANFSVNAAGARLTGEGLEFYTHGISGNVAGGFVGGGTGNKAIIGTDFALVDQSVGVLNALRVTYAHRRPANTSVLSEPYINFIVDINGDGSVYKIFVLDQASNPALNLLNKAAVAGTVPEDHEYTLTWIGDGRVKIVNELAGVTPVENEGAGWLNRVFRIGSVGDAAGTSVLAEYPNARFVHAYPADGGLPDSVCLPATLLVLGDSNWTQYTSIVLREFRIN